MRLPRAAWRSRRSECEIQQQTLWWLRVARYSTYCCVCTHPQPSPWRTYKVAAKKEGEGG
eukprot:COSAG05_NODE_460_length_9597_cov_8.288798_9_plen_60_part_00